MASFLGLGLFDPDEADEPTSGGGMFSDNLDDYTFDSIETRATGATSSSSSIATPIPTREVSHNSNWGVKIISNQNFVKNGKIFYIFRTQFPYQDEMSEKLSFEEI